MAVPGDIARLVGLSPRLPLSAPHDLQDIPVRYVLQAEIKGTSRDELVARMRRCLEEGPFTHLSAQATQSKTAGSIPRGSVLRKRDTLFSSPPP